MVRSPIPPIGIVGDFHFHAGGWQRRGIEGQHRCNDDNIG